MTMVVDITKGDLIKSKQILQINISFSVCVIRVELIDDRRIAHKYIIHFYMQCYKNCYLQKLLFRDDCDLKNSSIFLFV